MKMINKKKITIRFLAITIILIFIFGCWYGLVNLIILAFRKFTG